MQGKEQGRCNQVQEVRLQGTQAKEKGTESQEVSDSFSPLFFILCGPVEHSTVF